MRLCLLRASSARRFFATEAAAAAGETSGAAEAAAASAAGEEGGKGKKGEDDVSWKSKRDYMRAIVEAHYERTPNPVIGSVVKKRMFELHMSDPAVWTAEKVARTFGVPRGRVQAILNFAKLERSAFPNGTDGTVFDGSVEEMLEQKFGVLLTAQATRTYLRDEKFQSPRFEMVEEEVGDITKYGWATQQRMKKAPAKELSDEPSEEFSAFRDAVVVTPAPEGKAKRKFRLICVDTSARYKDEERPIVIQETDYSVRTADWTERRYLMTLWRGRRRKMTKGLKAMLKQDMLVDVDKFYMDDTAVGQPDFFPNNSRLPPTRLERTITRLEKLPYWLDLKNKKRPNPAETAAAAAAAAAAAGGATPEGGAATPAAEASGEAASKEQNQAAQKQ